MRNSLRYLCILFVLLTLALPCAATVQNAVVYGTVYDVAGKPMGGVTVLLENPALGLTRVTISSPDGSYTIAEIPPAEGYRVTAQLAGRKIDVREGIVVNVGDERVIVPPLRAQAPSTSAAEPAPKKIASGITNESVSSTISGVITGEQLRMLPLYNRNFLALGLLTPNTHDVEAGSALAGATFSIAGARVTSNNFLLDGTDNVASSSNQAIPFQVNDSIQEFRVISAGASAEYGRNAGGVVNVVTRRASNAFHGSAFGFFGNDALNSDNPLSVYTGSGFAQAGSYAGTMPATPTFTWVPTTYNQYVSSAQTLGYCTNSVSFAQVSPSQHACAATGGFGNNDAFNPATVLRANDSRSLPFDSKQFGVNLGGAPVKDHVFLFGSYEGTRIDNPNPIFERVPSAFDKTYNPLVTARGFGAPLPLFGQTNPDFVLAQNILSLYPKANVVGVPDALEFYRGEAPNNTGVDNFLLRMDAVQGEKSNWTFRYSAQKLNQLHDATLPEQPQYPGNGAVREALNQNFSATYTRSLTQHLITEARLGLSRFRVNESPQDASVDATELGLPRHDMMTFLLSGLDTQYGGVDPFLWNGSVGGWQNMWAVMYPTLDGLFPFARLGAPLNAPSKRQDNTVSLTDGMAWSHGKHSIRFGGEYRHLNNRFGNEAFTRGMVVSRNIGEFTSDSESTDPTFGVFPNYLAPSFDYALRQPVSYDGTFVSYALAGYVQDTWRVNSRLTLTGGLRYEFFSPPQEKNHNTWNFDPAANGLVKAGSHQVVDTNGVPCGGVHSLDIFPGGNLPLNWTCNSSGNASAMRSDRNNFAPRLGIAYDVFGNAKTVLRAGIGWYYDQMPVSYAAQLMYNRPTGPVSLTNPQATYGQLLGQVPFGNSTLNPANITFPQFQAASSPMAVSARDFQHSDTPYSRQINASLQQQITNNLAIEVGYVGSAGVNLPVVVNSGFSNEWFCTVTPGCDWMGPVYTMTNQGESSYHSLMARVRAAEWHGLRLSATYNYSRSLDNASNSIFPMIPVNAINELIGFQYLGVGNSFFGGGVATGGGNGHAPLGSDLLTMGLTTTGAGAALVSRYNIPQDPAHFLRDEWGPSDFNSAHSLVMDFNWSVPSLHKAIGMPKILDNWALSGILSIRSGQPFTIFSGPIFGESTSRANISGAVRTTGDPSRYIDATSATLQPAGAACMSALNALPWVNATNNGPCIGNSGRNAFTGPAFATMDFSVQKSFPMGEARSLVFRTEFYNLFNRANYYNPISTISNDGSTLNPDFGKILSAHSPRQIQLALRFNW